MTKLVEDKNYLLRDNSIEMLIKFLQEFLWMLYTNILFWTPLYRYYGGHYLVGDTRQYFIDLAGWGWSQQRCGGYWGYWYWWYERKMYLKYWYPWQWEGFSFHHLSIGMSGRRCSWSPLGGRLATALVATISIIFFFHHHCHPDVSVTPFFINGVLEWKKLI